MMRAALLCVAIARTATADPAHDETSSSEPPITAPLEGVTLPLESADANHLDDSASFRLSPNLVVERSAEFWNDSHNDAVGWRLQERLARKLGDGLTVAVDVGAGAVTSRYGSGSYASAGISLTKQFQLADGNVAWIGLGANVRAWLQAPRQTALMLRGGFTFR
ncbi:MAG TPA: hypothetical protein VGG28_33065 [Kofleriaceae bacterium]|jgi:hypothetical protein